ncbi:MAG: glycosyl transferase [Gammaproteobacteria bacterium]|nr:glycosyl transferase [Gammaproteobacteria bacterium]
MDMFEKLVNKGWILLQQWFFLAINHASPRLATKLLHSFKTGRRLRLDPPIEFNEKLQWLKLYGNQYDVTRCADKFELRSFAIDRGCESALTSLVGVYTSVDDICWDDLPDRYVVKCTHGCGYNVVVGDKSKVDVVSVSRKLRKWLKRKYGRKNLEYHYDGIQPRVIIERFIEGEDGGLPLDYKVYCFSGRPAVVLVCKRNGYDLKMNFYRPDWVLLPLNEKEDQIDGVVEIPKSLEHMLDYSARLSKGFIFVRVDFYDSGGKAILGEMTFTPGGNMSSRYNEYGQRYLGDLVEITGCCCKDRLI